MTASKVTLVHLSDVHLGPLPRVPLGLLNAKRAAGAVNWYRDRRYVQLSEVAAQIARDAVASGADHIAVSGDLANLGLPSEIARAAQWLLRLGAPDRVSVVPGNHDIYSTHRGRRLGVAALQPWAEHFTSCAAGAAYCDAAAFPFVRIIGSGSLQVALIGLNSAVETLPLIATGKLGAGQLAALARILDATRRDGLVRVVMLHHPPLPGLAKKHQGLTDAPALADVLREHGAELVIHGHIHRRIITPVAGVHGVFTSIGVPSASMGWTGDGRNLGAYHQFQFSRAAAGAPVQLTLVARGLAQPGGPVTELERHVLDAGAAA